MAQGQIKILFAIIALGFFGAAVVGAAYFWQKFLKPEEEARIEVQQTQQQAGVSPPDPGKQHFEAAVELIEAGDPGSALDRLDYMMRFYSDSDFYQRARDIYGEINVDLLLGAGPGPGKHEYEIVRGDALAAIARNNECTIEYIMRVNSRTNNIIHIGETLWLAPLEFSVEVAIDDRKLIVDRLVAPEDVEGEVAEEGTEPEPVEEFFKEYQILDINLLPTIRVPSNMTIKGKSAILDGRSMSFDDAGYHTAQKRMLTSRAGFMIQAMPDDPDTAPEDEMLGILISEADLYEIFTYIRTGTAVRMHQ